MIVWNDRSPVDAITNGLTLLAIVAGFIAIFLQYRSSLNLQRSNAREKLKLRVYEALNHSARIAAAALSNARSYATFIPIQLDSQLWQINSGFPAILPDRRADRMGDLHFAAEHALVDLLIEIEAWEIAFPGAELFRVAFNSAIRDAQNAVFPLLDLAMKMLPTEIGDGSGGLFAKPMFTAQDLEQIKDRTKVYLDANDTIASYVHDLRIEAQNGLLSGLFERTVPERQPLDPECKVIAARNSKELLQFFYTQTAMGRDAEEAASRVRAAVLQRAKPQQD